MKRSIIPALIAAALLLAATPAALAGPPHPDLPEPDFDFETILVTWTGNGEDWVVPYVRDARPEIVQIGMYGPAMHAYADAEKATGYSMQLPVRGQAAVVESQAALIRDLHAEGARVVVHFKMGKVVDAVETTGEENLWASFLTERWDPAMLGELPTADPVAYLSVDADGKPLSSKRYHLTYLSLCMNKPATKALLRRCLDVALDAGADGVMLNHNYYTPCACEHCQDSFRAYLGQHVDAAALREMGIADLQTHDFGVVPAKIPGYPAADTPAADMPLLLAAHRWAAETWKAHTDELLIDYGRSKKPTLIIGTWNHLGNLGVTEERAFLPIEQWGTGEHYFWYSGGYGPPDFETGKLGEGWLQSLYIRELGDGKPFMMGKYEATRMRSCLAESLATGGAGMGLYMRMNTPGAREVGLRYTAFARANRALYRSAEPYADVALLLPRQALMAGKREARDSFWELGQALLREHRLVTVIADEKLSADRLAGLPILVTPQPQALTPEQDAILAAYVEQGGVVVSEWPAPAEPLAAISSMNAPSTVRVAAYSHGPDRLSLHLVNYHIEPLPKRPKGPADEVPIPTGEIPVQLRLPTGRSAATVRLLRPDAEPLELGWEQTDDRLQISIPDLHVYGVVVLDLAAE